MAAPFLPTPSVRRATLNGRRHQPVVLISTHALREEGDVSKQTKLGQATISTHALREEGDSPLQWVSQNHQNFYPRPPRGGRQGCRL